MRARNFHVVGLVVAVSTSLAGTALAQPNPDEWGSDTGTSTTTTTTTSDPVATSTSSTTSSGGGETAAPAAAAGDATWGIGTTWPTGGDAVYANILKAMNPDGWLDLGVSLRIDKADPDADTVLGIGVRGGYRMYRMQAGRVRPYVEPFVGLDIATLDEVGDSMTLTAGGIFGVDFTVLPQFTLGGGVGLGAVFSNGFDTTHIGTFTSQINATFWW